MRNLQKLSVLNENILLKGRGYLTPFLTPFDEKMLFDTETEKYWNSQKWLYKAKK